jgi:hypothetical protein
MHSLSTIEDYWHLSNWLDYIPPICYEHLTNGEVAVHPCKNIHMRKKQQIKFSTGNTFSRNLNAKCKYPT